jgi:hypothetical protein
MAFFTQSCSGCFESEDGRPIGGYPWDEKAHCYIGAGCKECGYTGKRRIYFSVREYNAIVKADNAKLKATAQQAVSEKK